MLEKLFISKVRIRILKVFLETKTSQPPVEIHVRALVRMLDEEINAIRRELKNLENAGILIAQESGNKIVFRLNTRNPLIPDLRQMLYKDSDVSNLLIKGLESFPEVEIAVLSHHYIDQLYTSETDIDLLLVGKADINILNTIINQIEKETGKQLRVSLISKDDFNFRKKKRDSFITNIVYNQHITLLGNEEDILLN
jgi:DNA-binding transcriptional ArsR family regulator